VGLSFVMGILAAGCTATLHHGAIHTMPVKDQGAISLAGTAQNMRHRIGWGTFTIFAIPVAPVTVNGDGDRDLMLQVKDAVEQAGFKTQIVDSSAAAGPLPVLSCKVQKFSFRNYTWLFPIVFNWGTIRLEATITQPDGKVMWTKTYTGKANGFYDFDPTVNSALTVILNEMASDLANAQFPGGAISKL